MKRKLASKVSNASIDKYYDIAIENGALGGKISGAGGGGFLNIFALPENHTKIIDALRKVGLISCRFNYCARGTIVCEV